MTMSRSFFACLIPVKCFANLLVEDAECLQGAHHPDFVANAWQLLLIFDTVCLITFVMELLQDSSLSLPEVSQQSGKRSLRLEVLKCWKQQPRRAGSLGGMRWRRMFLGGAAQAILPPNATYLEQVSTLCS